MSGSCVTISTVIPCSVSAWNSAITSTLVLLSRFPVGSSASNSVGSKTWDGMVYGPEVGTYHAKLQFVIPGEWAVAIRFRRDSLHLLERTDWMQDVLDERPDSTR